MRVIYLIAGDVSLEGVFGDGKGKEPSHSGRGVGDPPHDGQRLAGVILLTTCPLLLHLLRVGRLIALRLGHHLQVVLDVLRVVGLKADDGRRSGGQPTQCKQAQEEAKPAPSPLLLSLSLHDLCPSSI